MPSLVTAIIKPSKLDDVQAALKGVGVQGMTVTEVRGFGRQRGQTETYRGAEYVIEFLPKMKVEVICGDDLVAAVVDSLTSSASSGRIGDGKVWVVALDHLVRIRTGEVGADAI
jgi:nitrogen regulatory protein PII